MIKEGFRRFVKGVRLESRVTRVEWKAAMQGVFVETNMGTRLAVDVPRDITVRDFMREFEREHFESFPTSGEIQVSALMVEREPFLYRLSDSMSLKSVFQKEEVDWFLHAEARALTDCNRKVVKQEQEQGLHDCVASKVVDHVSEGSDTSHPSNPENFAVKQEQQQCLHDCVASKVVDHVSEGSDISHPSNPENFVTTTKIITKGNCKRWRRKRGKRFRQQLLPGKLGKLFFFTKKRKRKKNVSLPAKVDQTGMEIITVDDTGVPMHIDENKTVLDDCASGQEIEPAEEHLASISWRDGLTETSSEAVVSVSGIINKYFLNLSEDGGDASPTNSVTSRVHSSPRQHLKTKEGHICSIPQVTPSTSIKFSAKKLLPLPSSSPTDFGGRRYKHDKPEVGERLVMASYSLGISPSNKHPAVRFVQLQTR
uniref:uncharacterized protein LOC105352325 isoform X1 n=1 Tax=Fragaria vesca subsp. vesca TaxID=101020 RepID=UPI0005C81FCF|nr:PREDICTED: uncharacterized protein LOC105352325 isoform X1 [Fragaria vesca subsp. vesca]